MMSSTRLAMAALWVLIVAGCAQPATNSTEAGATAQTQIQQGTTTTTVPDANEEDDTGIARPQGNAAANSTTTVVDRRESALQDNKQGPKVPDQAEVDQLRNNPNVPNDPINTLCWVVREVTSEYFAWLGGEGQTLKLMNSKGLQQRLGSVLEDLPADVLPFADRLATELRGLEDKQTSAGGKRIDNYLDFFEGFDFSDWPAQAEYLSAAETAGCAAAV